MPRSNYEIDPICYEQYEALLRKELVPALGCTEPGAVGYAAAKVVQILGAFPEHIDMYCSANIIKNVKSVTVPNSDGMKGIEAAAILGLLAGDPEDSLVVFKNVTDAHREKTLALRAAGFCKVHLQEGEGNLYIRAEAFHASDHATVVIKGTHTNIIEIRKNGKDLMSSVENLLVDDEITESKAMNDAPDKADFLSVAGIIDFASTAEPAVLKDILQTQLQFNTAIAEEGMSASYGAEIGKTIVAAYGDDIKIIAKAKAVAGSDARMGGSPLPVVINSGSGNQGITVTVPVAEYAKALGASEEKLYRALAISNLISIHIKKNIGELSAFCGAVSAACGSGAAITYLSGGSYEAICDTITGTLANVGGIICDGAKASCAAKIAASLDAAILSHEMTKHGHTFRPGDGIVADNIEDTIKNFGIVGCEGMRETDIHIMKLMIEC